MLVVAIDIAAGSKRAVPRLEHVKVQQEAWDDRRASDEQGVGWAQRGEQRESGNSAVDHLHDERPARGSLWCGATPTICKQDTAARPV